MEMKMKTTLAENEMEKKMETTTMKNQMEEKMESGTTFCLNGFDRGCGECGVEFWGRG